MKPIGQKKRGGTQINKRQQLKETATRLFTEKGYHQTSIQKIAKECQVSKGAFYKHFDSKEDLLIEIVKDNHVLLFEKSRSLRFASSISNREILQQKIEIELEQMKQNSSIFLILFREFPPSEESAVSEMMENFRFELIEWHKQCLLEAFGDRIRPVIWDFVTMYEGVMREYITLMIFHGVSVSTSKLSVLIVSSLQALADYLAQTDPVLSKEDIFQQVDNVENLSVQEQLDFQVQKIDSKIDNLSLQEGQKKKFKYCLADLKEESKKKQPKIYLMEALTSYLKTEQELNVLIKQAEQTIAWLHGEKGED